MVGGRRRRLLLLLLHTAVGDTMDDANFEHTTANGAILRLTRELAWIGAACLGFKGTIAGPRPSPDCMSRVLAAATLSCLDFRARDQS